MKQNPCPVVGEITEPTGIGLDELDGAVEAFGTGIADSVLAEVEQSLLVTPGRFHNAIFLWQSAEDRDWLNMAPVGREFGSPDYDRLMQQDFNDARVLSQ